MSKFLNKNYYQVKDEYYTPLCLVKTILPYIPEEATIWCPFDKETSEFVKELSKDHKVIYSHVEEGKDFFNYEPREPYDLIISNPPYSKKLDVFKRLYELNKPFAMVMNISILNYNVINTFFINHELELLIVNKKVSFIEGKRGNMFNSSYFCHNLLPRQLIFTKLEGEND